MITALYADENGEIFDCPGVRAAVRIGDCCTEIHQDDLIRLPKGADLMFLPGRKAVGFQGNTMMPLTGRAVAAILPAGYTRTFLPAYEVEAGATVLPLYGYTAVVLYKDALYVAAKHTDNNEKWQPLSYNTPNLKKLVARVRRELPQNRIVEQTAQCSLQWHCCTAQNLFYRRWEAGIPVSPACNAACLGCISLQSAECCPSPQSRIRFSPTAEEIAEVGIYHLSQAPDAIVSFGQGCEGEPSLAAERVAEGIRLIRSQTMRGQINMNTNAGYTKGVKKIIDAGLDTMRVSIISARQEAYQAYYRGDYTLENVKDSILYAKEKGLFVSLNLLYFPGFNDREEELASWKEFLGLTGVDMIQMRNLNMDPDAFLKDMPRRQGRMLGTRVFIEQIKKAFPDIKIGSFSHYIK